MFEIPEGVKKVVWACVGVFMFVVSLILIDAYFFNEGIDAGPFSVTIRRDWKPSDRCEWTDQRGRGATSANDKNGFFECKPGSYLRGIHFWHIGGQDATFQEATSIECCAMIPESKMSTPSK